MREWIHYYMTPSSAPIPVPMNMTGYTFPSSARTLSTTMRVRAGPLVISSGLPVSGRTASSIRGRSRMNCRVLSGRSRELPMPSRRAALLMH